VRGYVGKLFVGYCWFGAPIGRLVLKCRQRLSFRPLPSENQSTITNDIPANANGKIFLAIQQSEQEGHSDFLLVHVSGARRLDPSMRSEKGNCTPPGLLWLAFSQMTALELLEWIFTLGLHFPQPP
jgi:hypothetical protein